MPLITIVTPSYNQGKFLEETILSVINQDYTNLEYFIIDGGSTDNSVDIIKRYEKHLAYWVSEPDKGQSDALNKGFSHATGDYFTWVNSDDILLSGALNSVGRVIKEKQNLQWIAGNTIWIDEEGKVIRCSRLPSHSRLLERMGRLFIGGPSTFFTKDLYLRVNGLREELRFNMDTDLWWQFVRHGVRPYHIPEYLMAFRVHASSKTSSTLAGKGASGRKENTRLPFFCIPRYITGQKEERDTLIRRYGNNKLFYTLSGSLHRIRQFLNGNYMMSYNDLNDMFGKNWQEIFTEK